MLQSVYNYFNSHPRLIKRVQYFLIFLFLFLIGFDIYLAVTDSMTISNVIKDRTDNGLFILTYFWGVLAANLFITRKGQRIVNNTAGSVIIIGIALMIMIFNVETEVDRFFISHEYQFSRYSLSMSFGLIIGLLFWRQPHPSAKK